MQNRPRRPGAPPPYQARGPIGFRLAHELEGLLTGIRADGIINMEERDRLQRWLDDNSAFSDVRPFSELASHVDAALADGHLSIEECDDLLFVVSRLTTVNPHFDALRAGMQMLMGIIAGVMADRVLNDEEARAIATWTEEWAHLKGLWPYDECHALVMAMLAQGRIGDCGAHLQALTEQFPIAGHVNTATGEVPPLLISGICALSPEILFRDRDFTFTGESNRGSRSQLWELVAGLGGRAADSVTRRTDYLVVCDCGSPFWAFSCYGRKVEKAYNLRRDGHGVLIVHETDFWDAVADHAPSL